MDVGVEMEMEIPPGARPIGHATQGFWGDGEMEMEEGRWRWRYRPARVQLDTQHGGFERERESGGGDGRGVVDGGAKGTRNTHRSEAAGDQDWPELQLPSAIHKLIPADGVAGECAAHHAAEVLPTRCEAVVLVLLYPLDK